MSLTKRNRGIISLNLNARDETEKIPKGNKPKTTLAITGDSWVQEPGDPNDSASKSIIRNLNALLGNYFEVVNINAVGGDNLADIQARFATDVIAFDPGYCAIIGGVNSIAQDFTADQMFTSTKAMIDDAISNGIIPIVFPAQATEAGFNNGAPASGVLQDRVDAWSLYNSKLLTYSIQNPGWIYIAKAWQGIIDHELTVNTVYLPGILATYQFDIGHPEQGGAYRIAKDMKNQIADTLQIVDVLPWHDNDKGSGCHNPMQKATGTPHAAGINVTPTNGTLTGTPAEGWMARLRNEAAPAACTLSQVARTDIEGGFWQKCVCTNMDQSAQIEIRESDTTAFNYDYHLLADHDIAEGDVIEFYAEVKLHTISGSSVATGEVNAIQMDVQVVNPSNGSVDLFTANQNTGTTAIPYIGTDFDDTDIQVISTGRYTVPATAAKWYLYLLVADQGAGHTAGTSDYTFELGRVGIRKLS